MANWRDRIVSTLAPHVARLTIVADPDGLLREPELSAMLYERGFTIIVYDDPVAFRYRYEAEFRSRWDRGETPELIVAVPAPADQLERLPFDLLQIGRRLTFTLDELFPYLSRAVVAALDRTDFDALFAAYERYCREPLGDNAAKDFILRHVFQLDPAHITQPADLLRVLLRRHYRGQRLPAMFDERFIWQMRQSGLFAGWPLETIVPDREAFFAFLQERWPLFLDTLTSPPGKTIYERTNDYPLAYAGPTEVPFADHDVRVYIDNLFLEGMLQPITHPHAGQLAGMWVRCGLKLAGDAEREQRLARLIALIEQGEPAAEWTYSQWLRFAYQWANLNVVRYEEWMQRAAAVAYQQRISRLNELVDQRFAEWMQRSYAALATLPAVQPVMIHHLPRLFHYQLQQSPDAKIAFLLVDGLAIDQWLIVRDVLRAHNPQWRFREQAVFTWVPTITPIARQAAFAGHPPFYFAHAIDSTDHEERLWRQFWQACGLPNSAIGYRRGLGDDDGADVIALIEQPHLRVIGLVIDKIDRIMHGMELGMAGMHQQVRLWAAQGYLQRLIEQLHKHHFDIYLASDHGNIEARGIGRPVERALANTRGERVCIFHDERLRSRVKQQFPDANAWPTIGLPEAVLPLIAPDRAAFAPEGSVVVSHGGLCLEEVIVPVVTIERMST